MSDTLPERDELVFAVIKKILPYGAFCTLPEYKDREAFLHVSEVAPRWIKNIHEFISEGQRLVVKVYRVDTEKNQVDISLKRVNEEEKRNKQEHMRTEKRAEKLIELAVKQSQIKLSIPEARARIETEFGDLFACFQSAFDNPKSLDSLDIPESLKAAIIDVAVKNIRKRVISISAIVSLVCYGGEGVEKLKEVFLLKNKNISIHYLGAPSYKLTVVGETYKAAEKSLASTLEHINSFAQKNNCDFSYIRPKGE